MSNSADDILSSLKGSLKDQLPQKRSEAKTHEVSTPTISFKLTGGWPHSFPYSYVRSTRHTPEGITVKTHDAIITIKGKELASLYGFVRRQKISEIALSSKQETSEQQPFIESISIHYIDEEITCE